jgi:hypothetical protein
VEDWGGRQGTSAHPPPALFEPDVMHELDDVCPVPVDSFEGHRFEYGLILKSYNLNSISMSVSCIPNRLFTLFRWSRHPKVLEAESTFPWPSDWLFSEGDKVIVLPSRKREIITALSTTSVEVNLGSDNIVNASWSNLRKALRIGDYVEVTGGDFRGKAGWIDYTDDEVVGVVENVENHGELMAEVSQILNFECPEVLTCSSEI